MKNFTNTSAIILFITILLFSSCAEQNSLPPEMQFDHVFKTTYQDVRLGDGVPLGLELSIRWRIDSANVFTKQFTSFSNYDSLIIIARGKELASNLSNTFPYVDSVFTVDRTAYVNAIKDHLMLNLGESGVEIKEVIVSNVIFPVLYTKAQEAISMNEMELEAIRQKNIVDIEKAEASKKKVVADGEVKIKEAKLEGQIAEIEAKTEESKRKNLLAKAQTESKVAKIKAQDAAEKIKLIGLAELEKDRGLKDIEMEKLAEIDNLDFAKKVKEVEFSMANEIRTAELYNSNPNYANFLVNKELASKVEIAVLPSNTDNKVFGSLLNKTIGD